MESRIRAATTEDLGRLNEIYNFYIVDDHTSFDTEPWDLDRRRVWFERYSAPGGRYQAHVVEIGERVMGFASSSPFRPKVAYDTSVETTIVLDHRATGWGLGQRLLSSLLDGLEAASVHRAYALIALPNQPSVALHERLGYIHVGVLNEVGHKLDRFHSVAIMERRF